MQCRLSEWAELNKTYTDSVEVVFFPLPAWVVKLNWLIRRFPICHLAKSLATVSLGQVTKAAQWVPDVYVSDAIENARSPTVLSSWNIKALRSTVWEGERWKSVWIPAGTAQCKNSRVQSSKYRIISSEVNVCVRDIKHQSNTHTHTHHNQSFQRSALQCLSTGQPDAHRLSVTQTSTQPFTDSYFVIGIEIQEQRRNRTSSHTHTTRVVCLCHRCLRLHYSCNAVWLALLIVNLTAGSGYRYGTTRIWSVQSI